MFNFLSTIIADFHPSMDSSSSAVPVEPERAMAEERVELMESQLQLPSAMGVGPADQGTVGSGGGGVQQMEQLGVASAGQLQAVDEDMTPCVSKPSGLVDTERSAELRSETEIQEATALLVEETGGTAMLVEDTEVETTVEETTVQEGTALLAEETGGTAMLVEDTEVEATVRETKVQEAAAIQAEGPGPAAMLDEETGVEAAVRETEAQEAAAILEEERTVSSNADGESTKRGASCSPERQSTLCNSERTIQAPSGSKSVPSAPDAAKDRSDLELQGGVTEASLSPDTHATGVAKETLEKQSNSKEEGSESKMDIGVPDTSSSAIQDHSTCMQDTLKGVKGEGIEAEEEEGVGTDTAVAESGGLRNQVKEESCSRDPTPEVGGVLTKTMVDEERRLRDGESPESTSSVDNEVCMCVETKTDLVNELKQQNNIFIKTNSFTCIYG